MRLLNGSVLLAILMLSFIPKIIFGQEQGFDPISFEVEITERTNSFKTPYGWRKELIILSTDSNTMDRLATLTLSSKNRGLKISIYNRITLQDSTFIMEIDSERARSSCRNYNGTWPFFIASYTTNRFFVSPDLCPHCNFETDKKCKKLAKAYSRWVEKEIQR